MLSPMEQSCRHCGLGRRTDGSIVPAFPDFVCPGHDIVVCLLPAAAPIVQIVQQHVQASIPYTNTAFAMIIEDEGPFAPTVAPVVPLQSAVLSVAQQLFISNNCGGGHAEHKLIARLTPYLVQICQGIGACFVNSEEYVWLPQAASADSPKLVPDAFASLIGAAFIEKPVTTKEGVAPVRAESLRAGVNFASVYKFGVPVWKLRETIVLFKFTWEITRGDRGLCYKYLQHMSSDDKQHQYHLILCDHVSFYIMRAFDGSVNMSAVKRNWVDGGSVAAIQNIVGHTTPTSNLVQGLATGQNLTLRRFLGAGSFGSCFAVTDANGVYFALKVVRTWNRVDGLNQDQVGALVDREFNRLLMLSSIAAPNQLPVMGVVPDSLLIHYSSNFDHELGRGYLMDTVGVSVISSSTHKVLQKTLKSLFRSIAVLHRAGRVHHDARVQNAVFRSVADRSIIWIDVIPRRDEPVGSDQNTLKRCDVEQLVASIFKSEPHKRDPQLMLFVMLLLMPFLRMSRIYHSMTSVNQLIGLLF